MRFIQRVDLAPRRMPDLNEWEAFRLELREALGSVRRHLLTVVLTVLACLGLAGAVTVMRPASYVGTAQILLDPRGLKVLSNEIVPSSPTSDVNDAVIETQTRFLTSDVVLRQAVVGLGLQDEPGFSSHPGLRARLIEPLLALAGAHPAAKPAEDPIAVATVILGQQTTFLRQGKSFVVDLSVKARNPELAARIATAISQAFIADMERRRRDTVNTAREAMVAALSDQGARVLAAENAVELYKRSISVVDADGRSLNTARLVELNSQLLAARSATRTLAARVAQVNGPRASGAAAGPPTDVLDSAVLSQLKINFADISRQQENLRATLGPRHPAVVELDAQARSLKAAVARESARLATATRSDYAGAQARERALEKEVAKAEAETTRTNGDLVRLRQLEREASAQRSVYEKSLERERELLEQEHVGTTNASVVSVAKPNRNPVGLKPALLLAAGGFLGLLLGIVGAVLFDRRGGRLHSPARLTARTGLPVIGVLPLPRPRFFGPSGIVSLLSQEDSEAARVIHRIVEALDEEANVPAHLLVLSASSGSASSVVALNLVLAQAGRGHRTLLVDGDTRSGRLASLVPRDGHTPVMNCAVEGFPSFSATVCERVNPVPIKERARGYDRVVTDGGAGRNEVWLRQLAAAADAILLVAESGVATAQRIEELRTGLMAHADKLTGVLMVVPGKEPARLVPALARPNPPRLAALRAETGSAA